MEVSAAMQHQAKVLGDPSRFRLFQHIVDASQPVVVAELTELLGFNHNAIRQHLALLVSAGLIDESDEVRTTRGRPRKQYELRADALNAFSAVSGSYQSLADLLLEVVSTGATPYEVGRRSGASDPIDADIDADAIDRELRQRFAAEGFEPVVVTGGVVSLEHCPFADVAAKNPDVVCEIHRGLVDGYLSAQSNHNTAELQLRPPHRGGCHVVVNAQP